MTAHDAMETARLALSMLDLTDLSDNCDEAAIGKLCASAVTPHGPVAAVCIWPRFVAGARDILGADSAVRIATVVNFPSGEASPSDVVVETVQAIADGADEIDLVIPYGAMIAGDEKAVSEMVGAIRGVCAAPTILKTIIEAGELKDEAPIRRASELCLEAGADFIKTSTGKVAVNATPQSAEIMLRAIGDSGLAAGFKAAGGVRSVADAGVYLHIAETVMGAGWATPETFRFGASGLLGDVLAVLSGNKTATAPIAGPQAY